MKKILVLNYLNNKTTKDRILLDELYYNNPNFIIFTKKIYGPIKKYREINEKLYGINLEIYEKV